MSDRVAAALLAIVFTALAVVAVVGHDLLAGRVLFRVSETHGVHLGDLLFAGAWAVGVACCWRLWRRAND